MSSSLPRSALVLTPKAHGADGVSALTGLVAGSLHAAGIDTRVLALEQDVRRDLGDGSLNVPVESADGGKLRFVLNGIKASPRGRRPELVVATHLRMLPAAVPLMASGVPVTTFLLGVECWKPLTRRDRSLLSRSGQLLPISRWTRDKFVAANPSFSASTMTVCPLGVPAAASTDITPVNGRALIVGRLWSEERYKGHDLLIDVWPAVQRACPHAELMIVGDGDDRPRLETRVREAGLSAAIHFAGLVSQDALRRHFMESQVFVLPSEGEGFGLVFLEAMRAARPCIAAPGAAEEIVVNGQTGRVIAARDTHSLTGALIELLGNPALCESLGAAARRRFDDHYTAACFKERLLEALSEAHATC